MTRLLRRTSISAAALAAAGLVAASMSGCNDAQQGTLLGAGAGAGAGAIVGHNMHGHTAEGALIGAGIGAITGYIIGNESDKAKQQQRYSGQPY